MESSSTVLKALLNDYSSTLSAHPSFILCWLWLCPYTKYAKPIQSSYCFLQVIYTAPRLAVWILVCTSSVRALSRLLSYLNFKVFFSSAPYILSKVWQTLSSLYLITDMLYEFCTYNCVPYLMSCWWPWDFQWFWVKQGQGWRQSELPSCGRRSFKYL